MQSSPAAIMQSANLFVFVMNNPVRWLDPLGLFAWNEGNDHWFALRQEVESAGGSVSWNARTATATASIFGVNVNFARGSDGVRMTDNRMYVRADTFYNAVVGAAGHMAFVGGMTAFGSGTRLPQHASIQIFIAPGNELWDTGHFNRIWGSVGHATIGGFTANRNFSGIRGAVGEIGEPMVGLINDGFDRYLNALNSMTRLPWVTTEQILNMFSGVQVFTAQGAIPYNPTGVGGHNSNSFIAGLLTHAGVRRPNMSNSMAGGFPGWSNPIPTRHFRHALPREFAPGVFFL